MTPVTASRVCSGRLSPVCVRAMHRDDVADGLRLCRASHWNQVARDWELFLTMSPDGCRVAINEHGAVIGSVATLRYGEVLKLGGDGPGRSRPARRRHRHTAARRGAPSAGRRPHRAPGCHAGGARRLSAIGFSRGVRATAVPASGLGRGAGPCARGRRVESGRAADGRRDLAAVFALEFPAFGADRSELLRAFRHGAPENAWVAGDDAIDGFLLGRHGHTFEHLGPLVAREESVARRLVDGCLAARSGRSFILDAPPHDGWRAWLAARQFTVQRPFVRMYRGPRKHEEVLDGIFAIAGAEFS